LRKSRRTFVFHNKNSIFTKTSSRPPPPDLGKKLIPSGRENPSMSTSPIESLPAELTVYFGTFLGPASRLRLRQLSHHFAGGKLLSKVDNTKMLKLSAPAQSGFRLEFLRIFLIYDQIYFLLEARGKYA
jgi:hypothetical protein